MDSAISKNGVPIRLTEERWFHIVETHDEMAGRYDEVLSAIEDPDYIIQGYRDALVAMKMRGRKKFIAVIYKELGKRDGFVITAFLTSKVRIEREVVLWERKF
jgi:hypothetical protein